MQQWWRYWNFVTLPFHCSLYTSESLDLLDVIRGICIIILRLSRFSFMEEKTCTYQGLRIVCFFWKFGVLCFLETPVLRFALLPYYRRYQIILIYWTLLKTFFFEIKGFWERLLWSKNQWNQNFLEFSFV